MAEGDTPGKFVHGRGGELVVSEGKGECDAENDVLPGEPNEDDEDSE